MLRLISFASLLQVSFMMLIWIFISPFYDGPGPHRSVFPILYRLSSIGYTTYYPLEHSNFTVKSIFSTVWGRFSNYAILNACQTRTHCSKNASVNRMGPFLYGAIFVISIQLMVSNSPL